MAPRKLISFVFAVLCSASAFIASCQPGGYPDSAITLLTPITPSAPSAVSNYVQLTRIIDGDTIEVSINGRPYSVRYIGVDTPEPNQPFGYESAQKNQALLSGKQISLEKDISDTDRYGRLLCYVYADGLFVNAELVRQGYASVATFPPDVKYQDYFLKLQKEAQESGRGLWARNTETPTSKPKGAYVGSVKSNKYHYPNCMWAKEIHPENEIWFDSTSEAKARGYVPCKVCNPPN